jgi:hypothetical protein
LAGPVMFPVFKTCRHVDRKLDEIRENVRKNPSYCLPSMAFFIVQGAPSSVTDATLCARQVRTRYHSCQPESHFISFDEVETQFLKFPKLIGSTIDADWRGDVLVTRLEMCGGTRIQVYMKLLHYLCQV